MTNDGDRDLAAKLKAKVALAALRGDATLAELARQFNLNVEQIAQWKHELELNAAAAFLPTEPPKAPTPPSLPTVTRSPTHPMMAPPEAALSQATAIFEWPTAVPERPDPAQGGTEPEMAQDDDFWGGGGTLPPISKGGGASAKAAGGAASATGAPLPAPRAPGFFGQFLIGWREKRLAARVARELMKLHRIVRAGYPGAAKPELYRRVVMARQSVSTAQAEAVLERATESFATWPVERALTFRDVVHYLVVSDYLASNQHVAEWTRENLGRVVASIVPDSL